MTDTAYQSNNATFCHGNMSTFDMTNLPGDPMGQGPYGRASNWPDDGCHPLEGTISARYPIPQEYGQYQQWVTGPKGQNFAECDNYASYNNVGYRGQIWPAQFATPNFQLWEPSPPTSSKQTPTVRRLKGSEGTSKGFTDADVGMVAVGMFVIVIIVLYLASQGM